MYDIIYDTERGSYNGGSPYDHRQHPTPMVIHYPTWKRTRHDQKPTSRGAKATRSSVIKGDPESEKPGFNGGVGLHRYRPKCVFLFG